jgi:hypothetical protein
MGDWLPENNWILEDVSRKVGGSYTKTMTRTISHTKFFEGKGITDLRHVKPDNEMTIDYIPKEAMLDIQDNLRNGDIGALIFANKTDIFSAHMWMVMEVNGEVIIRESTTRGMTTIDTPYKTWAEQHQQSNRYVGITLMRVRDDINQPGKIIMPWEIAELKQR